MSLGPVMLTVEALDLTQEERELLQHPQVGGVILFSYNYENPAQVQNLIEQIHHHSKRRLLIAVDHEGGRVQRFRQGFTALPAAAKIGSYYNDDPHYACQLAEHHGWLTAAELRSVGVDFSFAPVLDIDKGLSTVIGNRAWHSDYTAVSKLTQAYIKGMQQAGMGAVGKHFPGHGGVVADSHHAIPTDERIYQTIAAEDMQPFADLINQQLLAGIMPAHIIYSQIDALPAGFSHKWLQQVLRGKLAFQGAIFSDDLTMVGASCVGDMVERVQLALEAGCDQILICNDRTNAIVALEILERQSFRGQPETEERLLKMYSQGTALSWPQLISSARWQQAQQLLQL